MPFEWDFFLAHAGADTKLAEELYGYLNAGNVRVFLDSKVLKYGDYWPKKIQAAQQASYITIVIASTNTDAAHYERDEIEAAIAMMRRDDAKHRVIPIFVDDCTPYGLRCQHGIRLNDGTSLEEAAKLLLKQFSGNETGAVKLSNPASQGGSLFMEAKAAGIELTIFDFLNRCAAMCTSLCSDAWSPPAGIAKAVGPTNEGRVAAILSQAIGKGLMKPLMAALDEDGDANFGVTLLRRAWHHLELVREFKAVSEELGLPLEDWRAVAERTRLDGYLGGGTDDGGGLAELQFRMIDHGEIHFVRLLERAARRAESKRPAEAGRMIARLKKHAEFGQLHGGLATAGTRERLHLVIGLDYDKNAKAPAVTDAWWFFGERDITTREVPDKGSVALKIRSLIQEALQQAPKDMVVELLAPNELMCLPREVLCLDDEDFGACWLEEEHPVVLRWHPRLKGDPRYEPGTWEMLSKQVRESMEGQPKFKWFDATQTPELGEHCHVAGLCFAGPIVNDPQRNRTAFLKAVRRGGPYMCWTRTADATEKLREETADLVRTHMVERLPGALKERRGGSLSELVLFMDEPERNPYKSSKYQDTPQRGQ